jgi:hypothetical protein
VRRRLTCWRSGEAGARRWGCGTCSYAQAIREMGAMALAAVSRTRPMHRSTPPPPPMGVGDGHGDIDTLSCMHRPSVWDAHPRAAVPARPVVPAHEGAIGCMHHRSASFCFCRTARRRRGASADRSYQNHAVAGQAKTRRRVEPSLAGRRWRHCPRTA